MTYVYWDSNKAGEIASAKGQTVGYVCGLDTSIAAPSVEVLNQNGYSFYQNQESGDIRVVKDRNTYGGSVWSSDTLGVTFDYTGSSPQVIPNAPLPSQPSIFTPTVGANNDIYQSNFAANCDNTLARLNAAQYGNVPYSSTQGLATGETIDPITGEKIDREKSEEIDSLANKKSNQYKFDKIAELIYKVKEKQSQATAVVESSAESLATTGAVVVGATGAAIGAKIGGTVGSFIPVPVVGTLIGAAVGGLIGWGVSKAVDASCQKDADKVNNESAQAALEAGNELKEALEGLSDEELIAFERYYYEQTGVEVTDVLMSLEVDEDSSTIAQQSGIDGEYLAGLFDDMDESHEILKSDSTTGTTSGQTTSLYDSANIQVLQQEAQMYYNYWQQALKGQTVTIDGETKTAEELKNMYLAKVQELEGYQNGLD